mmetsp:Transcript_27538/g.81006  ORF Transcript_27538/g.81006 Transcript_27538/m.81006 type:complete len:418 (-) Transcript_27538:78-1331(-)
MMASFDGTTTPHSSAGDLMVHRGSAPQASAHRKHVKHLEKTSVEMDISFGLDHGRDVFEENDAFACKNELLPQQRETISAPKKAASNQNEKEGTIGSLKVGAYFLVWYGLNVVYNIMNKKVLNTLPAPVTVASLQLAIGALFASSLWSLGLRPAPKLNSKGKKIVQKIGLFHAVGQLMTVISLGSGTVSFTHIVKATEPFFSALVSAVVLRKWMKPQVYIALLPVVGGVSYACFRGGLDFSWLALSTALGSNLAFALRAVFSKIAMDERIGDNISSVNLFGVVTAESFMMSVPIVLLGEGASFVRLWSKMPVEGASSLSPTELGTYLVLSGLFHYLNNEVMYLALKSVHPVTLAVGNTMKRVFILAASVIFFHDKVTKQAAIGSAVGLGGVLLYSLTKQHYERVQGAKVTVLHHDKE